MIVLRPRVFQFIVPIRLLEDSAIYRTDFLLLFCLVKSAFA